MSILSRAEKVRLLASSDLFKAFSQPDLERLAGQLVERHFSNGQGIFYRNEPGSSMMAVIRGRVRIGLVSAQGREVLLQIVEAGQIFGELALLDGKARSADATALGNCSVLVLDRRDLLPVLARSPAAAQALIELVCWRLRHATERLEGVALMSLASRLARFILHRADDAGGLPQHGRGTSERVLTQTDLARLIGASRQKVNLQLGRWLAEGILAKDGEVVRIQDRQRLAELAEALDV